MGFDPSIPPAARTSLDIAIWFLDRARADDRHLPFQALHRMLYLAQSLYSAKAGGILMPAIFLAEEMGPTEPNLHRLLADGRPDEIMIETPTGKIKEFLESVWDRYGHMPMDRLNDLMAMNRAYLDTARGYIIDNAAMAIAIMVPTTAPDGATRVLRSQTGAPVTVRSWTPAPKADAATSQAKKPLKS